MRKGPKRTCPAAFLAKVSRIAIGRCAVFGKLSVIGALVSVGASLASGCAGNFGRADPTHRVDAGLARAALGALAGGGFQDPDFPDYELDRNANGDEVWPEVAGPPSDEFESGQGKQGSVFDVIVGEFLAIVPGVVLPGLGHLYAGDRHTAGRLMRVGWTGILVGGIGGGLGAGGYFIDEDDDIPDGYAYTLYSTGAVFGVIGLTYYLTAYVYDIVDTPRAVLTGRKPPRSAFVDSLDIFD